MRHLFFDTETRLFAPGYMAPKIERVRDLLVEYGLVELRRGVQTSEARRRVYV